MQNFDSTIRDLTEGLQSTRISRESNPLPCFGVDGFSFPIARIEELQRLETEIGQDERKKAALVSSSLFS
jgi:hypothetical protein